MAEGEQSLVQSAAVGATAEKADKMNTKVSAVGEAPEVLSLSMAKKLVENGTNNEWITILEKGVMRAVYGSSEELRKAIDRLGLDSLPIDFLDDQQSADKIAISKEDILNNAIEYATGLLALVDQALARSALPKNPKSVDYEGGKVLQKLADAGALEAVNTPEKAEEYKSRIRSIIQELSEAQKKVE